MKKIITLIVSLSMYCLGSSELLANDELLNSRITISSTLLNEKREVQVLLPESYFADRHTTYPVVYLLDGDFNFNAASGVLDMLANKGQMIPNVILVGIADKGTDKYRQYMTPTGLTAPLKESDVGNATSFLQHITKELQPLINSRYRTNNENILYGHSIGGLFVLNALIEAPNAFKHYLSSSPSLWLNDHAFVNRAKEVIGKTKHARVSLHLSLGDETRMGQYGLIDLLDDRQPTNVDWQFTHYPEENHNTVSMVSFRDGLKSIFKGWFIREQELNNIDSPNDLLIHYKKLALAYQLNQAIPTPSIKAAIRYFYRHDKTSQIDDFIKQVQKQLPASESAFLSMYASYIAHFKSPDKAIEKLINNEKRFSTSIEYIKSIAVQYEKLKDNKKAFVYYQKAKELAKQQSANQWQLNIIDAKLLQLGDLIEQ